MNQNKNEVKTFQKYLLYSKTKQHFQVQTNLHDDYQVHVNYKMFFPI